MSENIEKEDKPYGEFTKYINGVPVPDWINKAKSVANTDHPEKEMIFWAALQMSLFNFEIQKDSIKDFLEKVDSFVEFVDTVCEHNDKHKDTISDFKTALKEIKEDI